MDPLRSSLPRCTPPPLLFCAAHLRRTGSRVPADRVIDDEAFCRACFRGRPIIGAEKLRGQSKSQRKNPQNFSHLSASPGPPDSNRLRTDPPATKLPDPDADHNDGIPASHRLTALETTLLNALQEILLDETMMLAAIHRYRIPVTGRKKKAAIGCSGFAKCAEIGPHVGP
jgi:hypothetical protein